MKQLINIFLLVLAVGLTSFSFNSDPKKELLDVMEGIRLFYKKNPQIYQEVEYHLYQNHNAAQKHSKESGLLIYGKGKRYAKIGPVESLSDGNLTYSVDHNDKILLISNRFSDLKIDPAEALSRFTKSLESYKLIDGSNGLKTLVLINKNMGLSKSEIDYDPTNFQIKKITLFYNSAIQLEAHEDAPSAKPRIEIRYSNTNLNGKGSEYLDSKSFAVKNKEKWKPAPKYADYELIKNIIDYPASNK